MSEKSAIQTSSKVLEDYTLEKSSVEEYLASECKTDSTRRYATMTLKRIAELEKIQGCKVYDMEPEIWERYLSSTVGTREDTSAKARVLIRDYVLWCKENGYCKGNRNRVSKGDDVPIIQRSVFAEEMFASPDILLNMLNDTFGDKANETVACVYKTYYWLAYSGLSVKEVFELTSDEIDFEQMVIRHNDRLYKLYEQAKQSVEAACKELTFTAYAHRTQRIVRAPGNRVLRTTSARQSQGSFRSSLSNAVKRNGAKAIHRTPVFYSGLFYRILNGTEPADTAIESAAFRQVSERKSFKKLNKKQQAKSVDDCARSIRKDYERWLKTFYPEEEAAV